MQDLLFYIFSTLTLLCGLLVVFNPFSRNPVTSVMFLVLTIISMSGLFVLLKAFFLAAVQILVYAGAVIVLFLFVIMLLDVKEEVSCLFFCVLVGIMPSFCCFLPFCDDLQFEKNTECWKCGAAHPGPDSDAVVQLYGGMKPGRAC